MDIPEAVVEEAAKALRESARTADRAMFHLHAKAALAAALSVGEVRQERIDGEIREADGEWEPYRRARTVVTWPDGTVIITAWKNVDE